MQNMEKYPLIIPVTPSYLEHWSSDKLKLVSANFFFFFSSSFFLTFQNRAIVSYDDVLPPKSILACYILISISKHFILTKYTRKWTAILFLYAFCFHCIKFLSVLFLVL